MRVAIVGSGVSGMASAWLLSKDDENDVHVFEANGYIGGHTNTVQVSSLKDKNRKIGVDTGFIVCNPVTYPNFLAMMAELGVELSQSDMSFSVSRNKGAFEWGGRNLDSVFAQRSNLIPLTENGYGLYQLIWDLQRFHEHATSIAAEADQLQFDDKGNLKDKHVDHPLAKMTLGTFFKEQGYSQFFYDNYVIPMTACIWSTPADLTFDKFPVLTLVRFMRNHCLLQIGGRPKWKTVLGGSSNYIPKALEKAKVHLNARITQVQRSQDKVVLTDAHGKKHEFDHVIFATHSDQALSILGDSATPEEKEILGAIKFSKNRAVLHRDESLMPIRKACWSSWNYLTTTKMASKSNSLCLTYWSNCVQPYIDAEEFGNIFVTMNPLWEPKKETVLGEYHYEHPIYTPDTIAAQERLNIIQNKNRTSFAGAWTNYGFHEDGATSGLLAAVSLGAKCPFQIALNGGHPTHRVPMDPPLWLQEKGLKRYVPLPPVYAKHAEPKKSTNFYPVMGLIVVLVAMVALRY
ncbi:hypothetical protein EDD86DRAFT_188713 [Gorgonomyces haynaldii]|nr:hypothetical protein EDD86DRAFT_188713 [Gorgonomyces haynaldii]